MKRMNLPFKVAKNELLKIKFIQKIYNDLSKTFLSTESHSDWDTLDFSFLKTSGSSTFLELNDIDLTT